MKPVKVFYWLFTGSMVVFMLFSGITGLVNSEQSKALIVTHLGYPEYFLPVVSWVKVFGVIALLVPGFPRLKEWVYAGFTFDLCMAIYSFIAIGDPASGILFILFGLLLVFGSYVFYHKLSKMAGQNVASSITATERKISVG